MLSGIILLICSCHPDKELLPFSGIAPSKHTLLALSPDFSISVTGDTINRSYSCLRSGKEFLLTGILRVDGKAYRFLGGDSLRILPLAPLSNDSFGWSAKYSDLFPG